MPYKNIELRRASRRKYAAKHIKEKAAYLYKYRRSEEGKEVERRAHLKRTYGITIDQYNKMLADQNGKCFICLALPLARRLAVDHDHKTKVVRGLLCWWCNRKVIGNNRTTAEMHLKAAEYLIRVYDGRKL